MHFRDPVMLVKSVIRHIGHFFRTVFCFRPGEPDLPIDICDVLVRKRRDPVFIEPSKKFHFLSPASRMPIPQRGLRDLISFPHSSRCPRKHPSAVIFILCPVPGPVPAGCFPAVSCLLYAQRTIGLKRFQCRTQKKAMFLGLKTDKSVHFASIYFVLFTYCTQVFS